MFIVVVRAARGRISGDVTLDMATRGLLFCDLCWQQRLAGGRQCCVKHVSAIPQVLEKFHTI